MAAESGSGGGGGGGGGGWWSSEVLEGRKQEGKDIGL